jgi:cyclopropane fatty-acyl-phospholipid synthase-like methyltransferase
MAVNFNLIAPIYDFGENFFFGNLLVFTRNRFLNYSINSKSVLILGEGRGQFLNQLLCVNQTCKVTVVESSTKMIQKQKELISNKHLNRVSFHCISVDEFNTDQYYDLVCTHFFWDCFTQRQILNFLPHFTKFLKKDGFWINSDFVDCKSGEMNLNSIKIRILYLFFRLTTGILARRVEPFCKYAFKNSLQIKDYEEILPNFIKSEVFKKVS